MLRSLRLMHASGGPPRLPSDPRHKPGHQHIAVSLSIGLDVANAAVLAVAGELLSGRFGQGVSV